MTVQRQNPAYRSVSLFTQNPASAGFFVSLFQSVTPVTFCYQTAFRLSKLLVVNVVIDRKMTDVIISTASRETYGIGILDY